MRIGGRTAAGRAVAALALALTLAACSTGGPGDSDDGSGGSSGGNGSSSGAPTGGASPTPGSTSAGESGGSGTLGSSHVYVPADAPPVALAHSCAEILPAGRVGTDIGAPVAALTGLTISGTPAIALRQAGGVHCEWGGGVVTDGVPADFVRVVFVPNAASDFTSDLSGTTYTAGTKSYYRCTVNTPTRVACQADLLVNGWWVQVLLQSSTNPPYTMAAGNTGVADMLDALAAQTSGSATWTKPSDSITGAFCHDPAIPALLASKTGWDLQSASAGWGSPFAAETIAVARTHMVDCTWVDQGSSTNATGTFSFELVPGGSWALQSTPPADPYLGAYSPLSGVDDAWIACNGPTTCAVMASVGNGALTIGSSGASSSTFRGMVPELLDLVVAAG